MKVFITGASSIPGYKIMSELARTGYRVYAHYCSHEIPNTDNVVKIRVDFATELDKIPQLLREIKPDVIIHTAALDADKCEGDRQLAWVVNVESTKVIAKTGTKLGSYMLYLSTDYVFDGVRGLYKEDDIPSPINFYGLTKLIAENIVATTLDRYVIVRTSQIYGFGMGRKNFGRHVIESLSQEQRVRALVDQWLSPTLNTLLARAIREVIEMEYIGVLHIAGERINRFDFAKAIARRFGFNEDLIEPTSMSDLKFLARRPRDSSLDVSRAKSMIKTDFHSLKYSLDILYGEWLELKRGG